MVDTVTFHDFETRFRSMDRLANFPGDSLQGLFDYLEERETDTGTQYVLDVIELCCDFSVVETDDTETMADYTQCDVAFTTPNYTVYHS
jgi:hypothetical protein